MPRSNHPAYLLLASFAILALLFGYILGLPTYAQDQADDGTIFLPLITSAGTLPEANTSINAAGFNTTIDWEYQSDQAAAWLGAKVSPNAGDVNGDGYNDLAIGAYLYDHPEFNEGVVYVFEGSSSGPSNTPDWIGEEDLDDDTYGSSMIFGDFNGDGYDDLAIGARGYSNPELGEGIVYVYNGSASGLATAPSWSVESNQSNGPYYGYALTSGDFNSDGYSDLVVSAIKYDNGQTDEGKVWVYHGSSSGLSTTVAKTYENNQENAQFGQSLATGDFNADGYDDLVVGDSLFDTDGWNQNTGKLYVYSGSSSGLGSNTSWSYTGIDLGCLGSTTTTGDFNGDGYDDIASSALLFSNGTYQEGAVYVFHSGSSGLVSSPTLIIEGNQNRSYFGTALAGNSDVNGDGYDDLFIGAPEAVYDHRGRIYIYYGANSGLDTSYDWFVEGIQGEAQLGVAAGYPGDTNGDGAADVLVGQFKYSYYQSEEGRSLLYYSDPVAISGLEIHHSTPVEPGQPVNFSATVTTGTTPSFSWKFKPGNSTKTGTGQSLQIDFPITYTAYVTATNAVNSISASKVFTIE